MQEKGYLRFSNKNLEETIENELDTELFTITLKFKLIKDESPSN